MNRIVIAVVLAVLALGAGGVWALGQFGGGFTAASEARAPLVQEPEIVAAAEPPNPAAANDDAGLKSQPAPAKEATKPASKPATKPAATKPAATPTPAPVNTPVQTPAETPAVTPQTAASTEPAATPAPAEPAKPADP